MSVLELYARHDSLTDPGEFLLLYQHLPSSPSRLRKATSNLIVHVSWLSHYAIAPSGPISRDTLPIATRLRSIQALNSQSLTVPRSADHRSPGTCRDYALLLCSMLRHHAIAARVRCGFARYLSAGRYEDHWICEYWFARECRWVRADAQLDTYLCAHLDIRFDPADIPPLDFVTSDQAWRMARSGKAAADDFGHAGAKGLWFLRVNIYRDLLALTNQHISDWDSWRSVTAHPRRLDAYELDEIDRLASAIEKFGAGHEDICRLKDLATKSQVPPWQR